MITELDIDVFPLSRRAINGMDAEPGQTITVAGI